ncbi:hypothetical protein M8C21_001905 [Ambrosia artemisiifolia]|uniref:Uncharacterized protein n=1 Tax=Ambrosia artemisiifolia TaxID=4212 RepID=A0AAD5C073_AMBAR|nr:hypothetical protein M8C21_001905 [Ambrosia artemisiifolia]
MLAEQVKVMESLSGVVSISGVIIGIIGTGITSGHPSFKDNGIPAPPSRWAMGHTHTSSTAAGNSVDNTNVFGMANGTARGVAPLAHLAMYKFRLLIAGVPRPFHEDAFAIGAFRTIQKGIFVSCSAGNSGNMNRSFSEDSRNYMQPKIRSGGGLSLQAQQHYSKALTQKNGLLLAIKSAIMTTASQLNRNEQAIVDETELPANVFIIGSGHVNPSKANEPGCVFDIQPDDYIPYLCGLGYTPEQIQIRTVTNVGWANSTYTIRDIAVPQSVSNLVWLAVKSSASQHYTKS